MILRVLFGIILATTVVQFSAAAIVSVSCTEWLQVGIVTDRGKDQFRDKVKGNIYKYDDMVIYQKSIIVKMGCDDNKPPPKGYTEVPKMKSNENEGQSIGGFSRMCLTDKKKVCHLRKCRRYRGKTYCIRKCKFEYIETCF